MGPRGDTQSRQARSGPPAPDAPELTDRRGPSRRTGFASEAEAAAEAHRRNSDQCTGAAAWTTTHLPTGDWALRRSRMLVVSSPARPDVSSLDAALDGYPAGEIVSPSPNVDRSWPAFTRDDASDWEKAAIEHTNLAGMFVSAGNPEAAAPVIERALQAIAPHVDERPPVTAHVLAVQARIEAALGTASPLRRNALLDFRGR